MVHDIFLFINWFVLCYLILFGTGYILLLLTSIYDVKLRYDEIAIGDELELMNLPMLPAVTIIIAFYNEEQDIINSVQSALNSDYKNINIILVNDGSTDNTMPLLIDRYKFYKTEALIPDLIKTPGKLKGYYLSSAHHNMVLIDKTHVNRGDSINMGINASCSPLFFTLDADSILAPDAISELVYYMLTRPHAVAVGGAVYILNGCQFKEGKITDSKVPYRFITGFQCVEYLRSFLFSRAGWNLFKGALSFSGASTLFEHQAVVEVGGFAIDHHANDFEIITALHAHKAKESLNYQIGYTAAASVWTDVPTTLKGFWHQRVGWQYGTLVSLLRYKRMLFNPYYGIVGIFNYPFYLFGEALGGVVEFIAYVSVLASWYLGLFDGYMVLIVFLACAGYIATLTMATVLMDIITYDKYGRLRDIPWLLFLVLVETVGFRQYNVLCRMYATLKFIFVRPKKPKATTSN